jgi:hypothetical protein
MIGCRKRLHKGPAVCFADPPWNELSMEWLKLEAQVPTDHLARDVLEAMKDLDLTPLYDLYSGVGSLPIRPDLMLRVVLIEVRLGRSRPCDWFRDARENVVLQWAAFGIRPSRTCWYDFADRIVPLLDAWNATVLKVAKERGVTRAERGSLDGSFVAANASRHRLLNEKTLGQRLTELEKTCQADEANQPPQEVPGWMAKNPGTRPSQRKRYLQAAERLVELHAVNDRQAAKQRRKREKVVVSVSDPAAALGRDKYNVFRPLYNLQLLRDLDSPLYLAYQVFAQTTDAGTVRPLVQRSKTLTGVSLTTLLVDAGYVTTCTLALCQQLDITLYGPWRENDYSKAAKKGKKPRPLGKEHFQWDAEHNMYRCPEGHPMPQIGIQRRHQADDQVNVMYSYLCSAEDCSACPRQPSCCANPKRGRSVKRSEHEGLIEAHRMRMAAPETKALYKLRKQTIELAFADLKQHRSLRQFSGRGLVRTQRQVALAVLVHNLLVTHRASPPQHTGTAAVETPEEIMT